METQQIHRNTFEGGLNTDITENIVSPTQFLDGYNLSLVGDGKFLSLQDFKGTTNLATITTLNNTTVLGVFNTRYTIGTATKVPCITIFTVRGSVDGLTATFNISAYDPNTSTLYELYSENREQTAAYSPKINSLVDGVLYPENDLDILYFTDYQNRPRKLRCEIPTGYTPNFLDGLDIDLLKRLALGPIDLVNVVVGGSLLTGTYQIAYQMVTPDTNKYTKFSLLTNPIHVYTTINSKVVAGIGLSSNKKIVVTITPTEDELAYYTHFRLAIVENIGTSAQSLVDVGLTKLYSLSDVNPDTTLPYLTGGQIYQFPILSNTQFSRTTIDDIVIDLAAIERVKTITVRQNRMIYGNVIFTNLEYDNRVPNIASGTIVQERGSVGVNTAENDTFQSKFKGHFRDEVYRYAISYFDDYGNFSFPKTLDLSVVTDNQSSNNIDMRFPSIKYKSGATYYSILDANSRIKALGLELVGLVDHPSWAKGFVILRAKRKKRILFQTPIMHMAKLYGMGGTGNFPTIRREGAALTSVTDTTATPPGPSSVFFPYNMFYGAQTSGAYNGFITLASGIQSTQVQVGETQPLTFNFPAQVVHKSIIFPPLNIFENSAYSFTGNEQSEAVDAVISNVFINRFDSVYDPGTTDDTDMSGSFFATDDINRYYDSAHSGAKVALRSKTIEISNATAFDNYFEGALVGGESVWDFNKLKIGNVSFGFIPTTHRTVVCDFGGSNIGTAFNTLVFAAGSPTYRTHTTTLDINYGVLTGNTFLWSTDGLKTELTNIIEISNIVTNLDDFRYGAVDDFNEFIYTGTKVVFTNAEQVTIAAGGTGVVPKTFRVWGGDCVVSNHTFKLSDTTYTMVGQAKQVTGIGSADTTINGTRFKKIWITDNPIFGIGAAIMMIAFSKSASQYFSTILESEYNGAVTDIDFSDIVHTTTSGYAIKGASSSSQSIVPLPYNYNINLNKQNDQKIFIPKDESVESIYNYTSRAYYSDIKIYQTDIEGFDSVRVLNYQDLEERYGSITNLSVVGDRLFALQEFGVAILPVGERVLEVADMSQIAIRSGEFLTTPLYIDTLRGCQNLGSVSNTGRKIYFMDRINRAICAITADGNIEIISNKGLASNLRTTLGTSSTISDSNVKSLYNIIRDQYWLHDGNHTYIWNEGLQVWEPKMEFLSFGGGARVNNTLYLIGQNSSTIDTTIYSMYTGNQSMLMGAYVVPRVSFVANPIGDYSKVYDALLVNSTNAFASGEVTVIRESGTQVADTQPFSGQRGEGNWKVKILRDKNGPVDSSGDFINRLRGPYAIHKLTWNSGASYTTPNTLNSVLTKFTPSRNLF